MRRPFFARYDRTATWFDDLEPLGLADHKFFDAAPDASRPNLTAITHNGMPLMSVN